MPPLIKPSTSTCPIAFIGRPPAFVPWNVAPGAKFHGTKRAGSYEVLHAAVGVAPVHAVVGAAVGLHDVDGPAAEMAVAAREVDLARSGHGPLVVALHHVDEAVAGA